MKTPSAVVASSVSGTNLNSSSLASTSMAVEPQIKKTVSDKALGTTRPGLRSLTLRRPEDVLQAVKGKEIPFDDFLTEFKNDPKILNDIREDFFGKFFEEVETVTLPIFKLEY